MIKLNTIYAENTTNPKARIYLATADVILEPGITEIDFRLTYNYAFRKFIEFGLLRIVNESYVKGIKE